MIILETGKRDSLLTYRRGIAPLERGESSHAVGVTKWLSFGSAVDVSYELCLAILELINELVPIGLHFLAMTAPGSKKLDENGLSGRLCVPVVGSELNGIDSREKGESEGSKLHCDLARLLFLCGTTSVALVKARDTWNLQTSRRFFVTFRVDPLLSHTLSLRLMKEIIRSSQMRVLF